MSQPISLPEVTYNPFASFMATANERVDDPLDPNGDWVRVGWTLDQKVVAPSGGVGTPNCPPPTYNPDDVTRGATISGHPIVLYGDDLIDGVWCRAGAMNTSNADALYEQLRADVDLNMAETCPRRLAREVENGEGTVANFAAYGAAAPNQFLANRDAPNFTEIQAGVALPVVQALFQMEAALTRTPGSGVIHMPMWVSNMLQSRRQLWSDGNLLYTFRGTPVIADEGYTGQPPYSPIGGQTILTNPPVADVSWMYGTGQIEFRLGPTEYQTDTLNHRLASVMNRSTNDISARGEKLAQYGWWRKHFAVQVDETDMGL